MGTRIICTKLELRVGGIFCAGDIMKFLASLCIGLTVLFSGISVCPGQITAPEDDVHSRIERKIKELLKKIHADADFPGASLALILPDQSEITVTVGLSSLEADQPMNPSDRMMSASIGKTYFAAMAIDLIRQEKLSLDEKISKHLGDEEWFDRIPNAKDLTIAHLMRHQSGVPRYILVQKVWTDILADPDKMWRPGDQLAYIYDAKALHPAGKGWAYSDTNYILLGLVLQKISGKDVYEYVQEKFLDPHKLVNTIPNNRRKLPGLIQGYPRMFQQFGIPERVIKDGKFVFNPAMEWCGGGFACTSLDLARWARLMYSGELLAGDYVELMQRDAAPAGRMLGGGTRYGLGVMIRSTRLGLLLGHDGGFPGYTSTMGYFPEHKIAAAFMFNSDGRQALNRATYAVMIDLVEIAAEELTGR